MCRELWNIWNIHFFGGEKYHYKSKYPGVFLRKIDDVFGGGFSKSSSSPKSFSVDLKIVKSFAEIDGGYSKVFLFVTPVLWWVSRTPVPLVAFLLKSNEEQTMREYESSIPAQRSKYGPPRPSIKFKTHHFPASAISRSWGREVLSQYRLQILAALRKLPERCSVPFVEYKVVILGTVEKTKPKASTNHKDQALTVPRRNSLEVDWNSYQHHDPYRSGSFPFFLW